MAITKVSGRQIETGAVGNTQLGANAVTNVKVAPAAAIAESKIALARATRSLLEMTANDQRMIMGVATVTATNPWVDVTFAGADEFDNASFFVQATRLTEIPMDLYVHVAPGYWISNKVVTGFRLNLAVSEMTDVSFDYMAIGLQA